MASFFNLHTHGDEPDQTKPNQVTVPLDDHDDHEMITEKPT
jgi:hypothetical protein